MTTDTAVQVLDDPEATPVQQIYDSWGHRASVKEPDAIGNGERMFKVGGYSITVPDDPTLPAKVASIYNRWGKDENPMPNMSFSEGEMRIPVDDFADLMELADGLWRDATVRERFVECMAHRYAGPVEDEDRRSLLNQIQVEIYAKAIDRAIERLNAVETGRRSRDDYYRWKAIELGHYRGLYEYAANLAGDDLDARKRFNDRFTHPDKLAEYIKENRDPAAVESVGPSWYESRDFWRRELEAFFPEPTLSRPTPASVTGEQE